MAVEVLLCFKSLLLSEASISYIGDRLDRIRKVLPESRCNLLSKLTKVTEQFRAHRTASR